MGALVRLVLMRIMRSREKRLSFGSFWHFQTVRFLFYRCVNVPRAICSRIVRRVVLISCCHTFCGRFNRLGVRISPCGKCTICGRLVQCIPVGHWQSGVCFWGFHIGLVPAVVFASINEFADCSTFQQVVQLWMLDGQFVEKGGPF